MLAAATELAPAGMAEWLKSCPDIEWMKTTLDRLQMLEALATCDSCGETFRRKQLRVDLANPCADPSKDLSCNDCWKMFENGTFGNPAYRPVEWPIECDLSLTYAKQAGVLRDRATGKVVGTVTGYNPIGRFGRVTLFGFPSNGEYGTIDEGFDFELDEHYYN